MAKIIIPRAERIDGRTPDSLKYNKDCKDFVCLDDGTIVRECRYCNLSLQCRQVGIIDGKFVPMESHFLPIYDENGNYIAQELFCTGMYDERPLEERTEDDKVS